MTFFPRMRLDRERLKINPRGPGAHRAHMQVCPAFQGKLRVMFLHKSQPWHPQSGQMHEVSLAVARIGGPMAFFKYAKYLFSVQDKARECGRGNAPRATSRSLIFQEKVSETLHSPPQKTRVGSLGASRSRTRRACRSMRC